jgi:hypothetical protein
MFHAIRRCLGCVLLAASATALAQSFGITGTVPVHPVAGEPLVLHMTIPTSGSGYQVFRHRASVTGNVIEVDGCYGGTAFSVPGSYTAAVPLPALPAGAYSVAYYRRYSNEERCDATPPVYLATFTFMLPASSDTYPPAPGPVARVTQYLNGDTGFYFMTADEREQVALESGAFSGWRPDKIAPSAPHVFGFFRGAAPDRSPVCRFISAAFAPKSSHFYTADRAECDAVRRNPLWTYEGDVGYVVPADATGACPAGVVPLYRMYNKGADGAPTHIYTTWQSWYQGLSSGGGWAGEGVLGCVPPL